MKWLDIRENWYALYISIITKKNPSESLWIMGLTEGMNVTAINNRRQ